MTVTTVAPVRTFEHAPAPAYSPDRDPAYSTEGGEIANVARLMGIELMPWQRHVVDVGTEYRLDEHGRRVYKYKTVLVSVPRQSGKTTLMTPVRLHRLMTRQGIDTFATAQTGKDARARILKMIEQVEMSPLAPLFKPSRQNGAEGLQVIGNKSKLVRFSPVAGALHGETPHLVDFDEIWKYSEQLGDMLLGGASPGQITLGGQAQIWMISTKGTAQSTFMNKWVTAGETGADPSLAYFAWQMPAGMDLDEPATWWAYHPALGNTITEADLRKEMYSEGMSLSERIRAYANLLTVAGEQIIDPDVWDAGASDPDDVPPWDRIGVGVEVAPGNTCAAVVAGWWDEGGHPVIRVLHQAPGTSWLPQYLHDLHTEFGITPTADDAGPVKRVTDALHPYGTEADDALVPIRRMSLAERSTADLTLLAAARDDRTLRHDGSRPLSQAVASAQLRTSNGVERIDRDRSLGPVPSLIAGSIALHVASHPDQSGPKIQLFI